jgi:CubicO group peptidase (beta-lactamase class C family)
MLSPLFLLLLPLLGPQDTGAGPVATLPATTPALAELAELTGTWHATLDEVLSDGTATMRFALWEAQGGLAGGLRAGEDTGLLFGGLDDARGSLSLEVVMPDRAARLELVPADGGLAGTLRFETDALGLRAERRDAEVAGDLRLEVDLEVERPVTIDRRGLPDFLEEALQPILDQWVERERAVGVSTAFILDFEVVDVRSVGWQDFARRIPASVKTRYRWASISKSLCAVAALQLAEAGELDLDRDVREYVPEFPEKRWVLTTRHLLPHHGGVVHYQHGPIVTERTYDDPNPFRDRVLALDMFKETPLLFEPGSSYSYTTHGYSLLGAVVERAGEQRFEDQVAERVAKPLGMTTLRPDFHQSVDIPDQTVGYATVAGRRSMDAGDSNVAWKLPGGGFISSVEDLARFGLGLMGDELLGEETRAEMFTPQRPGSGADTRYGQGVNVETIQGFAVVGHGGSQRKTRTSLRVVPELGIGVAVMCNTESTDPGALSRQLLLEMLR